MRRFSRFSASNEPWFVVLLKSGFARVSAVARFPGDPARETLLLCAIASRTGRVLMGPADHGIDICIPGTQSCYIGPRLQQPQ